MKYKKITAKQFEDKINSFLNRHNAFFEKHQSKLSAYFEMKIYNDIVRGYEELGYTTTPKGLKNGIFKYKLSTNGYIENFSFFEIEKDNQKYWIIHNLKSESYKYKNSYITVDIAIIKADSLERIKVDKNKMDVVKNKYFKTFFECKFMSPFPELLASFIGLVFCLKPHYLKKQKNKRINHIAPSLICANKGSYNTYRMANKIVKKHSVNIFYNMAYRTIKLKIKKKTVKLVD